MCDLRFQSVKEGLFLLDAGVALYLYISRTYHPDYLRALFGKDKLVKGDVLSEDMINAQEGSYSQQVQNLVRVLREYFLCYLDRRHTGGCPYMWCDVVRVLSTKKMST